MNKYKYYKKNSVMYRSHLEQDIYCGDPRSDGSFGDCLVGTMALWWNGYAVGDEIDADDPDGFLNDLINEHIKMDKIFK